MSDYYTEQLVKKRPGRKDLAIKTGLIVLTVLTVLIVFIFPVGLILPILAIVLDVIMFRRLNVEYEYLYVNGDLDIDKIMNRAKRKRMFSMNVSEMELLAPLTHRSCVSISRQRPWTLLPEPDRPENMH